MTEVSQLDRVLDLLDTGLQSTTEPSFACDEPEDCARCQRQTAADTGDLCEPCRAFLVGDSDEDPVQGRAASITGHADPDSDPGAAARRAEAVAVTTESFERALRNATRRTVFISELPARVATD